jgi:hypothetical protein
VLRARPQQQAHRAQNAAFEGACTQRCVRAHHSYTPSTASQNLPQDGTAVAPPCASIQRRAAAAVAWLDSTPSRRSVMYDRTVPNIVLRPSMCRP